MKTVKTWLAMIATLLCSLTASAHDFSVGGIYYNITSSTDLTVEVTYRGYDSGSYTGAVTIPATITYNGKTYSVTRIGHGAFRECSDLTSITIPKNVTRIETKAFNGCTSLKEVNIEDGNTTLSLEYNEYNSNSNSNVPGKGLFYDCPLENIHLGRNLSYSSVSSYGYSPFYGKGKLISITIGDSVSSIGYKLFSYCSRLTNIIVEEGNEVYDSRNGCNAIIETNSNELIQGCSTTIIPESVTSIGNRAFEGCSSLTTITIPESVTKIGQEAFYSCDNLHSLTIPKSVTKIGQEAFYSCNNLHSLTIGSGVLSIGYNAFSSPDKVIWLTNTPPSGYNYAKGSINYVSNDQYTKLSNVKIYPYLSSMFEVDGVKYVPVSPSERTCHAIDCAYDSAATAINVGETASFKGVAMKVTEVMPYAFYGNNYIKEVSVSHLGNIGNYAFYDCDSVQSVELSNEGNIGYQAFYNCDGVINVVASNKGDIGEQAFYNCDVTESVTISNQGDIGSQAFYDCNGIKNVDIRNQGSIGSQAFYGCNGMGTAIVANKGTVGSEAFFGCSSLKTVTLGDSIGSLGYKAFYQCSSLQKIAIPDSVKSVDGYCFSGCSAMKSAVIGDGLTNIAGCTFENCTSLVDVTVGDGVTTISNYAFTRCFALTNISLGRSVATINNYAFQNCSSLPEITLSQAVTTVGDYVFVGCRKLADVIIADRTTALALGSNGSSALFADCPLDSVYIGGKITYNTSSNYGYSPFFRNTSLRSVVITDREEQIYENEFYGCTNLQNVTIGNGVKSIGNYAFSGCSSLEGFSFGSNMETIGEEAFSDCTSLTSITSHAAVPPTCGTQALDDINKWECVLGVPLGNADAYYAADQWKEFFFIDDVVEVDHYVLTYVVDGEVVHTEVLKHKDEVTMLAEPTKVGYEFSGWDKTLATMPAEDVIISGTFTRLPVDNLVILDTEENFLIDEEMECDTVTYTRHFNDTQWQALYVPFEIPYDSLKNYFEVADLNNVHQYDHNDDGVTDETVIEAFKMTSGVLEANYPYLIRTKEAGEKSITVTDAVLYATEENSIDCSSVRDKFTFTGTYSSLSSAELSQGEGYYTLINGEWQPVTEDVSLGAFRFYLKVDSRSGAPAAEARSIRMRIIGENGEDDATGIDNLGIRNHQPEIIYDLQGRRVENPTKGIYIVNGKRVVIK